MSFPTMNPFPLDVIAPADGNPVSVLVNKPTLEATKCRSLDVQAPATNTGSIFVGASTMNTTTLVGVLRVIAPGNVATIGFDSPDGNKLDLSLIYVARVAANASDKILPSARYA
jgi:hypothetical protein